MFSFLHSHFLHLCKILFKPWTKGNFIFKRLLEKRFQFLKTDTLTIFVALSNIEVFFKKKLHQSQTALQGIKIKTALQWLFSPSYSCPALSPGNGNCQQSAAADTGTKWPALEIPQNFVQIDCHGQRYIPKNRSKYLWKVLCWWNGSSHPNIILPQKPTRKAVPGSNVNHKMVGSTLSERATQIVEPSLCDQKYLRFV